MSSHSRFPMGRFNGVQLSIIVNKPVEFTFELQMQFGFVHKAK